MKYKHIIFDIDGTLLDTEYAVLHSLQDTIIQYSHRKISLDELNFALGIPGDVALKNIGIADVIGANEFWNYKMQEYRQHTTLFRGICEMLDVLHNKGVVLGVVTSKTRKEYETDFVPYGICDYFNTIICADDVVNPKPAPDPLFAYLNINKILAKETIYIGDTIYDSLCANQAGIDFGLALWGCHNQQGIECKYKFAPPNVKTAKYGK